MGVTEWHIAKRAHGWDHAVAESFFSSLRKERIKKQISKNRELASNDLADDIDRFDNRTRRQSHLSGVSPEQFEDTQKRRLRGVHRILGTPLWTMSRNWTNFREEVFRSHRAIQSGNAFVHCRGKVLYHPREFGTLTRGSRIAASHLIESVIRSVVADWRAGATYG